VLAILALGGAAQAQWVTQNISLQPGWNAVYLEVQPAPSDCETIFSGHPVEDVWLWNKRFSPVEFELDPDTPLAPNPHWLIWLPSTNTESFLSQVFGLQACQSYLIRVPTSAAPFEISVKGAPVIPHLEWFPHALNLVGFPINPVAPPTFSEFFTAAPQVDTSRGFDNELYTLDASGRGRTIVQPYRDRIQPGRAYWVKCSGALDYEGPLRVTTTIAGGLDFGLVLEEIGLSVANVSTTTAVTVTLKQAASEAPPAGQAELAGPVPLSYMISTLGTSNDLAWTNLPAKGLTKTLAAGETWSLNFGCRRNDMAPYTPAGTNGAAYQSILEIADGSPSLLVRVPVIAEKDNVRRLGLRQDEYDLDDHHSDEGLWVGYAVINEVTCPSYSSTNLLPTESDCRLRLILHSDAYGRVKLLQRVYLAWVGPATNGEYGLFMDEASVPTDSEDVDLISSAAFPLMAPVALANCDTNRPPTGLTNQLCGTVVLAFNDPTNPFLHRYHPLLDNKDWNFHSYSNAVESRDVTREILMDFNDNVFTGGAPDPFYGISEIGGTYEEILTGLREQPIHVKGAFYLQRVSLVNELH